MSELAFSSELVNPEESILSGWEKLYQEHFAKAVSIEQFIAQFNHQYQGEEKYQTTKDFKLDATHCTKKISCTGATILFFIFARARLSDKFPQVVFGLDNDTAESTSTVILIPSHKPLTEIEIKQELKYIQLEGMTTKGFNLIEFTKKGGLQQKFRLNNVDRISIISLTAEDFILRRQRSFSI